MSDNNTEFLAELDAQIHYHETQALSLKLQRNKRAPVSKLSHDVLLDIFLTARDFDEDQNLSKTVRRITHVCKQWRYLALHAPTLWTRPPTYRCQLQWTEIALQRAKLAPLDLLLDLTRSSFASNKLVLANMPRIAKLVVKGVSPSRPNDMLTLLPGSAPLLQELQISRGAPWEDVLYLEDEDDFDEDDPREVLLPPTAFRESPQLRRLAFQHIDFEFDSLPLSNLTSLSIKVLSTNFLPSWAQWTSALRRMPLLEELILDRVFPTATNPRILDLKAVDLPNLQVISIQTQTCFQLHEFLSLIASPRPKHLSLGWLLEDRPKDSQAGTIFYTAAKLVDAKNFGSSFTSLEVSAKCDEEQIRCLARSPEGCLTEIAFPGTGSEWRDIQAIGDFTDILHLTCITHFSVDADWGEYDVDALSGLLHKLPLLQTAATGRLAAFNFFDCLNPRMAFDGGKIAGKACLTELKAVTWREVDLEDYELWVEECAAVTLANRRKQGFPLQELTFQNVTGLTPDLLEYFTEGVPKVVVEPALR